MEEYIGIFIILIIPCIYFYKNYYYKSKLKNNKKVTFDESKNEIYLI